MNKNRFSNVNCLKGICAILIIMMHIRFNLDLNYSGYFFNNIVPSFGHLVFIFMILSGFGMFCGYYNKVKDGNIDFNEFYLKRFKKIAPFFFILIVIDIIFNRNVVSIIEGFMNMTFLYGLLPYNDLSSIGVAWTLGVIFVFYLLFPFFVFMLYNKRRAWISLVISVLINFVCNEHLFTYPFVVEGHFSPRKNILYCLCFFILGGIIFLYKDDLLKMKNSKINSLFFKFIFITIIILYLFFPDSVFISNNYIFILKTLILMGGMCVCSIIIESKIIFNKFLLHVSKYSMELYLCHMFIFRILEKTRFISILCSLISNIYVCYFIILIFVVFGAIVYAFLINYFLNNIKKLWSGKNGKKI